MSKLEDVYDFLKPHFVYRISPVVDDPKLRGKYVVFLGWAEKKAWDIQRARVKFEDSSGETVEYLLNPHFLIRA